MSISVTGIIFSILSLIVRIVSFFRGKKEPSRLEKFLDRKKYERTDRNKVSDAIAEGDSDYADVKRKEQQEKIDKLRRAGMWIIIFMFIPILVGCQTTTKPDETLSPTALKATEKTYPLKTPMMVTVTNEVTNNVYALQESAIITNVNNKVIELDGTWYAVHAEVLRTMDENQRDLISVYTKKNWLERGLLACIGALIVCIILLRGKRK